VADQPSKPEQTPQETLRAIIAEAVKRRRRRSVGRQVQYVLQQLRPRLVQALDLWRAWRGEATA
jgi:hypothetical protein